MSLVDYHRICYRYLCCARNFTVPTDKPINLGSIWRLPGAGYETSFEIALPQDCEVVDDGWSTEDPIIEDAWNVRSAQGCLPVFICLPRVKSEEETSILENGWIRCAFLLPCLPNNDQVSVTSACVAENYRHRVYTDDFSSAGWLAQACHIFNSLDIKSNLEDYGQIRLHHNLQFMNYLHSPVVRLRLLCAAVGPNRKFTFRLSLSLSIDALRNGSPGMFSNSRLPGVLVLRPHRRGKSEREGCWEPQLSPPSLAYGSRGRILEQQGVPRNSSVPQS